MLPVKKFGVWPMSMMMILSVGIINHVTITPLLLNVAGRDAWLGAVVAAPAALLWAIFPLLKILNAIDGQPIAAWLDSRGSAALRWLVLVPVIGMLLFTSFHTSMDAVEFANSTYIPRTPSPVVTFLFVGLCAYGALSGLRTIAFVSCVLLPFVVAFGDLVMSANIPHKDFKFLLPMAEHGLGSIVDGALYSFSALAEIYMIILFQPHLKGRIGRIGLTVLILFLALLMLGPVTGTISEFGPVEGEKLRYPAFSQWRLVTIGRYIEHLDFLAIYQWMSGSFIRVSMSMYLVTELLFQSKRGRVWGIIVLSALIGITYELLATHQLLYRHTIQNYFQYSGLVILALTLVLWVVAAASRRQQERANGKGQQADDDSGKGGAVV
ncbi:GerAB/ArcD/ProY family transporter [Paenibacillus kobensis]|uniref:GerAB/ArcD/ProY family transporter n=1 Tax=Paenibacillus kobensis TaxID=59841 RepID=UPI0013E2C3EF|nr:GerAB/ArcD/ProY family transporter [Paenibacillus kobensis]